ETDGAASHAAGAPGAGSGAGPAATRDVGFGTPPHVRVGGPGDAGSEAGSDAGRSAAPGAAPVGAGGPLATYARDLTALARAGELPPVVGREDETLQVIQTLLRRTKNNPVLVGDPGVGKTAVVEGLAQRIADGRVPGPLKNARLLALDLTALVAGAKYRGEFEERLKGVVDEVRASKDVVLFLDEVHTLVGAGGSEGGMDAANMLKPALARGELRCIGATTHDEYRERIARDGALARRFEPVTVDEPDDAAVRRMLEGARGRFEQHHGVRYTPEALDAIVKLARRHLRDRAFPDKAFDVLDEAAARVVLARDGAPDAADAPAADVTAADVAAVVGRRARVPVSRLLEGERERLLALEERLGERVFGQDEAVAMAADAARRMRADLRRVRKPASFLFVGPTGTGKTELAKALAEALFDDERALVRIDMAEYKESHAVSGLIGSRPGLVGSDKGGFLTEQVRRNPNSVVLFDEVEKAHPEVIDILLGVLDEGRLTDAQGRLCDFTNTLIILTSNLGVREATQAAPNDPEVQRETILKVVQASLRPELFNRIGAVVPFAALGTDVLARIVRKQLAGVGSRLSEEYGAGLQADADAVARLAELAYDPSYGARPVERTVERLVVSDLSRSVLAGDVQPGALVHVVREGDGVLVLAGPPDEVEAEVEKVRAENAQLDAERAAAAAAPPAADSPAADSPAADSPAAAPEVAAV
ncbi:MAG TPA: ATP-dependent Clp protease ATP-binding subunit, partial [Gemmatirosa sp.]